MNSPIKNLNTNDGSSTIDLKTYKENIKEFNYYKNLLFGQNTRNEKMSLLNKTYLNGYIDGVRSTYLGEGMFILKDSDILGQFNKLGNKVTEDYKDLREQLSTNYKDLENQISENTKTLNENIGNVKEELIKIESKDKTKETIKDRIIRQLLYPLFVAIIGGITVFLLGKFF